MRRRRTTRARAGYTLIEVMMAIGVLTASAVAIMALMQTAIRGNLEARQITTANQVAQRWVERLRRDSLNWTAPSNVASAPLLARTTYLRSVTPPGSAPRWFVPAPTVAGETANSDFYGNDLTGSEPAHYCSNVRLEWLYPGQAMRADVRVWWVRRVTGGDDEAVAVAWQSCAPGLDPNTLPTADFRFRMIHTSTVIRYTPAP